jgi:hypothetical protein
LYYSEVEIVTYASNHDSNDCGQALTQTSKLDNPRVVPFPSDFRDNIDPLESLLSVPSPTGSLDPSFLQTLPSSLKDCVAGTWIAPRPTMIVVIDISYLKGMEIMMVHRETPATGELQGPLPTSIPGSPGSLINTVTALPVDLPGPDLPVLGLTTDMRGPTTAAASKEGGSSAKPTTLSLFGTEFSPGNGGPEFNIIGGQTFGHGGTTLSLGMGTGPVPTAVVLNGITRLVDTLTRPPSIVVGGTTVVQRLGGDFVFGDKTLSAGGVVTVSGTTISLASNPFSSYVVINGATSTLSPTGIPIINFGGTAYYPATTLRPGEYLIAGQLLVPGSQIVVSGTTISLAPGATDVVIDGVTQSLPGYTPASSASSNRAATATQGRTASMATRIPSWANAMILSLLTHCILRVS